MMLAALITQSVAFVALAALGLRYLAGRDRQARDERAQHHQQLRDLLVHVQAPQVAVQQHVVDSQNDPDPFPRTDAETVVAMDKDLAEALARVDALETEVVL